MPDEAGVEMFQTQLATYIALEQAYTQQLKI